MKNTITRHDLGKAKHEGVKLPLKNTGKLAALFLLLLNGQLSWGQGNIANFPITTLGTAGPIANNVTTAGLTVTALTIVGASPSGTASTFGASGWTSATDNISFSMTPAAGHLLTLTSTSAFNDRRSGTGPTAGQFEYNIGSGLVAIGSSINWGTNTTSTGNAIAAVSLSAVPTIPAGETITLGVFPGIGASAGTWYINEKGTAPTAVFGANGTVTTPAPTVTAVPATLTNTTAILNATVANSLLLATTNSIVWSTSSSLTSPTSLTVTPASQAANLQSASGGPVAISSTMLTGLTPNTQYFFKASAANSNGTGNSAITSFTTLVNTPGVPTVTNPTSSSSSLTVTIDNTTANGNPTGTKYEIQETTTTTFVQSVSGALAATATPLTVAAYPTTYTLTGLTANKPYTFHVLGLNSANNPTPYGASVSDTTLASVPGAPAIGTATNSSLVVTINTATANNNAAGTKYIIQETNSGLYVQSNGTLGATPAQLTATVYPTNFTVTGLTSNTQYTFQAQALQIIDGTNTAFGPTVSGTTLENTPGVPTVNNATTTSLDVIVDNTTANGNAAGTQYEIQETTTGMFVQGNGMALGAATPLTVATYPTTYTVTGLTANKQYTFHVLALNSSSNATPYGTSANGITLANVPGVPAMGTATATSLVVTVDNTTANGDATGTKYEIEETTTSTFVKGNNMALGAATQLTVAAYPTSYIVTGLTPNTQYTFQAQALQNADLTLTAAGATVNGATLAALPGAPVVDNPTTASLDVIVNSATANGNPAGTQYVIKDTVTGMFVQGTNMSLGATATPLTIAAYPDTFTVTGLNANTRYTFRVEALQNITSTPTAFGTAKSDTTLGSVPAAPVVGNTTFTSIDVIVDNTVANGNPAGTKYVIQETTTGQYVQGNNLALGAAATQLAVPVYPDTFTVTGLLMNTQYTFQVQAVSSVNATLTAFGPTTNGNTLDSVYYSNGTGNLNDPATFGTNPDGTGLTPSNFSVAGITYHVANNNPGAFATDWTVSGAGSKVIVDNSSLNITTNVTAKITMAAGQSISVGAGGTLATNDSLILMPGARIGEVAGSITGNVIIQTVFPGQRGYRLLGQPYNADQTLATLGSAFDITGLTTGNIGICTSANPSVFTYTPGSNPAYVGLTTSTAVFPAAQPGNNAPNGVLAFVRGTTGQGCIQSVYTPSDVTLTTTGTVNTGSITETVPANGWNLISNPYPSQVDLTSIITSSDIDDIELVVPGQQALGTNVDGTGYLPGSNSSIIPINGAFLAHNANTTTDVTLTFTESAKTATAPVNIFKTTNVDPTLELTVYNGSKAWDSWQMILKPGTTGAARENGDIDKFSNSQFNLSSLSTDTISLYRDARDANTIADGAVVPLSVSSIPKTTYTIQATQYTLPADKTVYLHDKYTNTYVLLNNGVSYPFTVNGDAASQGNNRMELVFNDNNSNTGVGNVANRTAGIMIMPNPATSNINVSYSNAYAGAKNISIINVVGQVVKQVTTADDTITIPVDGLASGVYLIRTNVNGNSVTERFIKN